MANTIAMPSALTTTGQSEKWRRLRAQQRALVQRRVPTGMVRLRSERKARCLYKGLKTKNSIHSSICKIFNMAKTKNKLEGGNGDRSSGNAEPESAKA